MANLNIRTIRGKGDYQTYQGMSVAFANQPEYKLLFGHFYMWLFLRFTRLRYSLSRRIKWWVVAYKEDRVVGGFMIDTKGEIGTLVVTTDPTIQHEVMLRLFLTGRKLISVHPGKYTIKTFNTRLLRPLLKAGFHRCPEKDGYMVTIPLSWLTFSVEYKTEPRYVSRLLRTQNYYYLNKFT